MNRKEIVRLSLELILKCSEEPYFPRTISTEKSKGRQIKVTSLEDVITHFEESNWMDCRISLFGDTEINKIIPNAIFIDLDDKDALEIVKIRIYELIKGIPLIIFTGNGYAIIQPIKIKSMIGLKKESMTGYELATKFLKYSKYYLTNGKADPQNNPSLKSCLIRVPHTINSKNRKTVEFIQSWDENRATVKNIPFKKYLKSISKNKNIKNYSGKINLEKFQWCEKLLKVSMCDHRNFVLFDICRFLINLKKISKNETMTVIIKWLNSSKYPRSKIEREVKQAQRDGKLPRKLETIQNTNPKIYQEIIRLINCK
jgi:hypothetical protein